MSSIFKHDEKDHICIVASVL